MPNVAENLGNRYRIDARRSEFTVQAFSEGMLSFMGHNPTFAVRRYGGEVHSLQEIKAWIRCCWL